ncbi:UNVERIFIED_CONTAM: hypothetical protein Slati_0216400 [Sesamum latifolium]|uniref:Uncharacterized protein n=1 Tax=Sesamum latifolium TaxID=2727402 RepID=A0AAW2YBP8_9LAMI
MASSDESVRFVGESHPDEDPSEATSKRADKEEEEVGGNEGEASSLGEEGRVVTDLVVVHPSSMIDWGSSTLKSSHINQLRREFFIPNLMVIYAPGPDGRAPFPPANCLSFFVAQLSQAIIDKRLLGHFGLIPQVESLDESLVGEKGGRTPPTRSPKGTPTSSGLKGKRTVSPPAGVTSEGDLYVRSSFAQDEGEASSMDLALMRGVVTLEDRHILAPLTREDLERKAALYLMKRLEKENAKLKDAKKEAASHQSQMEKELKRLSKESAEHEETLRKAIEKAVRDYPYSDEGKGFLKAYWASRVDEFKKSDEYQQEVAKIAIPFLEYGFNACKDQFMAQGYPPAGEEPSFLDVKTALLQAPNPFANPLTPVEEDPSQESEEDLDNLLGEEGRKQKKNESLLPPKGILPRFLQTLLLAFLKESPSPYPKARMTRKTPFMGKRIDNLERESLYDAWKRFKSMLRKCPHHELPVWRHVQTFYNGITLTNRTTIDAAAGGTIMKKLPSEAFNIIDEIALTCTHMGKREPTKGQPTFTALMQFQHYLLK